MVIIRKTEDAIATVAPAWTTTRVVPRGVPKHIDKNLRGTLRYGLRVGSYIPNIQPDNRTTAVETIQAHASQLKVARLIDGIVAGSLIQVAGQEIQLVEDINQTTNQIDISSVFKSSYEAGSNVDLFGEPYVSVGEFIAQPKASLDVVQGSNTLSIEAKSGGIRGNAISFEIIVPTEASVPFSADVTNLQVTITLKTDSGAVPVTTYQQLIEGIDLVLLSPVNVTLSGDSSAVPEALAATKLSGGNETTTIGVRGRFPVLPGDKLWIHSDTEILLSGSDYTVVNVQGYSQSLSLFNSIVVLDHPIPRDLAIEDVVFLRGFPAYKSNVIDLPTHHRSHTPLGPCVVDYVSGRFTEGRSPTETLSIQEFDGNGDAVVHNYPRAVTKNTPILRVPMHQSALLFFKLLRGTVTYRNDKFVMRNDEYGRCEIWTDLIPNWPAPAEGEPDLAWNVRITYASPGVNSFLYWFEPNDKLDAPAGSGASNNTETVTISLKAGTSDATRLRIMTIGDANAEVEMGAWYVVGQEVEKVQYGIVAEQVGAFDWQTGSLVVKPYFYSLPDIGTKLDVDSLDSGTLLL